MVPGTSKNSVPHHSAEPGVVATIDLAMLLAPLRRRWKLFAAVASLIFVIGVVVVFDLPARYSATAELMIDPPHTNIADLTQADEGLTTDTNAIDTQVMVLQSRRLADRVASSLSLDQDQEFNAALRAPGWLQKLKKSPPSPASDQHTNVVNSLLNDLKVARSGLTYIIDVSFTSLSPVKSADIANAFANLYLTDQLDAKFEAAQQANAWLDSKLSGLRTKMLAADAAVATYKARHGLEGLSDSGGATITQEEISNLDGQIATARAAEAKSDAELAAAREEIAGGRLGDNLGDALSSQVIQDLRARRAQLSGQVAEMSSRYGPKYPDMVNAQRELSDIDGQIDDELQRITSGLELQAQVAAGERRSLEASLAAAKRRLESSNAASVTLDELQRDADAQSALYQSFLDRFKQTDAQQGMQQNDASVLSAAVEPTGPSFPQRKLLIGLVLILALSVAGGAVTLVNALDDRVFTTTDIEHVAGVAHIASIPLLSSLLTRAQRRGGAALDPALYVAQEPLSVFAESFRNLRTSLLYSADTGIVRTIAVTSALPGEGKTTSCVALARVAALGGVSTVVVDCDLQRHAISRFLAAPPRVGLAEVLAGTATLDEALVLDVATGVSFLPIASTEASPKDLIGTAAMDELIAALKDRFSLVLFDTSPLLPVSAARILATKVDTNVLIARWGKTPRRATATAIRDLTSVGARLAGVVLTQVDISQHAQSDYGAYAHYRPYHADQDS